MLPKGQYNPKENEAEMLKFWLDGKYYKPEFEPKQNKVLNKDEEKDDKRETFTIILPPPNANGNLHLGHMSGYAYQDIMGRYNRMKGKKVLLLPGKDHAGIQTEVVFEEQLRAKGKTKKDLGRESFYRACYEFCMKNSERARSQEQKIGLSADFDRELFTLDPRVVENVLKAFELMYKDGHIYRGKRLINWCPRCQSALADIDTEFKDSETKFVYFKYGFTEPDKEAINIKNKFAGNNVTWKYRDNKNRQGEKTPFTIGTTEEYKLKGEDLQVFGLGFDKLPASGETFTTKAIGILMKLNGNFRLITVAEDFAGDIKEELNKVFTFEIARAAGAHIILFDEYKEDKFYNNGFVMGTVRIETKFGDTAIAVDPDDERYKEYVGKSYDVRTLFGTSKINIISDNAVEESFGTGMVKITPAHSPEDWDIAQRHPKETMPEKQVIDFFGKLNHMAGKYEGMEVKPARETIIEDMKKEGMIVHIDENYKNRIRICERCKHEIEPLISHQWFVNTKPFKDKAKKLVEDGLTEIMPEGKKKTYFEWMKAPEDWCITRQLWWGYRIPVWYKGKRQEFVTETGEVREKIGDKVITSPEDYKDYLEVSINNPESSATSDHGSHTPHLTVIRHGETILNQRGVFAARMPIPLNDNGKENAQKFAKELKDNFDIIITSPTTRAYETAEIISKEKNIPLKVMDLIDDRDMGIAQGFTWEEFEKKFPDIAKENSREVQDNIPESESIKDVETRVDQFLEEIKKNYSDKKILVVTHVSIIRVLKRKLWGMSHEESRAFDPKHLELHKFNLEGSNHTGERVNEIDRTSDFGPRTSPEWFQDEDVLDTWFSSGQWPFLTLNANEDDFDKFYPTQVMETGWDILLFWVTRMMLLNPYRAEKAGLREEKSQIPFSNVYLHGLVLDKNGVKMSKSKGNGIDPFEMMEKYGTDALRFSFVVGNSIGQNYRLYEEKIESYKNFCNKIWNASRFVFMNTEDVEGKEIENITEDDLQYESNKKILTHVRKVKEDTTKFIDKFLFGLAAQTIYEEFWHGFCDVEIEESKIHIYTFKDKETGEIKSEPKEDEKKETKRVLIFALKEYLKMLHPFIPFITERLWREVPKVSTDHESIMYSQW